MYQRLIRNTAFTGIPFGIFMGLFFAWLYGSGVGVIGGTCCGTLFGISMAIFAESQRKKMESNNATFEGEAALFQGPANHFLKVEERGGWLTLTKTRLAFRSHGKNIQNQPMDIAISDILEVKPIMTAGFIANGLRITKKDGGKESFVVSHRKEWAKRILDQLKAGQNTEDNA